MRMRVEVVMDLVCSVMKLSVVKIGRRWHAN